MQTNMEKKLYVKPAVATFELGDELMTAASITGVYGDTGIEMGDNMDEVPTAADAKANRGSLWDDND